MTEARKVPCPTCGRPVEWTERSQYRPFCSRRCRLIDLGEWIEESRSIPGEDLDDDGQPWDPDRPH